MYLSERVHSPWCAFPRGFTRLGERSEKVQSPLRSLGEASVTAVYILREFSRRHTQRVQSSWCTFREGSVAVVYIDRTYNRRNVYFAKILDTVVYVSSRFNRCGTFQVDSAVVIVPSERVQSPWFTFRKGSRYRR